MKTLNNSALTGLSHHNVVGNSGSMNISCCALVHAFIMLRLLSADVHHQGPRVRPHVHVLVLIDIEVSPISCPGETEPKQGKMVTLHITS